MMRSVIICLLAATSSVVCSPAFADGGALVDEALAGRANQPVKKASLELTALEGDGQATFQLQPGKDTDFRKVQANGRLLTMKDMQWSLSFSSPLNEDGNTDLATLDSLASGFKFEVNFSGSMTKFNAPSNQSIDDLIFVAIQQCKIRGDADCDKGNDDEFARKYLGDKTVDEGLAIHKGSWRFGGTAAIGYDTFDYRDGSTLAELSESKASFSGGGYASYLVPNGLTSMTARAEYQYGYEAGKKQILCPGNPTNVVIQCFNDPVGAPKKDKSLLVSFDLRHYLGDGLGIPMAISPLVTYDVLDDVVGIDFPLYLVGDGKLGLSGGIRAGWRSDTKDAVVGIFVGKRFGQW